VNYGPRFNFLYIVLPFYFYSHYLLSCILLSFYHSIHSILYLQQTGEIDNLIVSWEQSSWLCCVQVSRCFWVKIHQQYFWCHCPKCHEAIKHHLLKFGSFSYWFDKPWFHNWGKSCCLLITPSPGVPNWSVMYMNTAPSAHLLTPSFRLYIPLNKKT
jgi:hypothetical protein